LFTKTSGFITQLLFGVFFDHSENRLETLSFAAKKAEDNQNALETFCLYKRLVAEIQ
jgi:hypothetical protein